VQPLGFLGPGLGQGAEQGAIEAGFQAGMPLGFAGEVELSTGCRPSVPGRDRGFKGGPEAAGRLGEAKDADGGAAVVSADSVAVDDTRRVTVRRIGT